MTEDRRMGARHLAGTVAVLAADSLVMCLLASGMDPPEELVQCKRIPRLALPYRQHLPPHGGESCGI